LVCCAQPATESPEALTHRAGAPWISCQPSTPAEPGPHSGLKIKVQDFQSFREARAKARAPGRRPLCGPVYPALHRAERRAGGPP